MKDASVITPMVVDNSPIVRDEPAIQPNIAVNIDDSYIEPVEQSLKR